MDPVASDSGLSEADRPHAVQLVSVDPSSGMFVFDPTTRFQPLLMDESRPIKVIGVVGAFR